MLKTFDFFLAFIKFVADHTESVYKESSYECY